MTNGEWLTELTAQAGITYYQQEEPYFLNITSNSPYFTVVQSSVEWELLNPSKAFNPSATLTREMVAYTLMNLISRTHEGSSDTIKDLQDCSYPDQVKAIHQANKGHGGAVNTGLAHATGQYFKVVDSDDWVDESALAAVMATMERFEAESTQVDVLLTNYVYEQGEEGAKRTVRYERNLPINQFFGWDEVKPFSVGEYLMMHSLIYRTQLLRDCGLILPEHTFYVDNVFVYQPIQHVQRLYYLDVDFYRYLIGRNDQSVNERVMMGRIDQQLKVNRILIEAVDFSQPLHPSIRQYLLKHLEIVTSISSALLNRIGTPEAIAKRQDLWNFLQERNPEAFKVLRYAFFGRLTTANTRVGRWVSNQVYKVIRKVGGY